MGRMLKQEVYSSFKNKIGGLFLKKGLKHFAKRMDSKEVGGAMIFGINKPVVKAHGNSDAYAFASAIKQVRQMVKSNIIEKVIPYLPEIERKEEENEQ